MMTMQCAMRQSRRSSAAITMLFVIEEREAVMMARSIRSSCLCRSFRHLWIRIESALVQPLTRLRRQAHLRLPSSLTMAESLRVRQARCLVHRVPHCLTQLRPLQAFPMLWTLSLPRLLSLFRSLRSHISVIITPDFTPMRCL